MHPALREVRGEFLQAQPGHPTHDPLIGPHHHVWGWKGPSVAPFLGPGPSHLSHISNPISSSYLHPVSPGLPPLPCLCLLQPCPKPLHMAPRSTFLLTSDLGLTLFPPPLQVLPVIVEPFQAHDPIMQTHPEWQRAESQKSPHNPSDCFPCCLWFSGRGWGIAPLDLFY